MFLEIELQFCTLIFFWGDSVAYILLHNLHSSHTNVSWVKGELNVLPPVMGLCFCCKVSLYGQDSQNITKAIHMFGFQCHFHIFCTLMTKLGIADALSRGYHLQFTPALRRSLLGPVLRIAFNLRLTSSTPTTTYSSHTETRLREAKAKVGRFVQWCTCGNVCGLAVGVFVPHHTSPRRVGLNV